MVSPFIEGLAAVKMGGKSGFVDKEGKIVINPKFEEAIPFINGLAAVKIGKQYGYIDKTGKIIINPQFDNALPFSEEGLAMIQVGDKVGFVDKEGKYVINPQFDSAHYFDGLLAVSNWGFKEFGRSSFSDGLALIQIGSSLGYIDKTGKIVINPQFKMAFPFYGGLAMVFFRSGNKDMAYIDKEGKIVWRETKETPKTSLNSSMLDSNLNSMSGDTMSNNAIVVNNNSTMVMESAP
jgi:hypothetical protein